jgi:lipopolysaccharide cholinephosphotransferase
MENIMAMNSEDLRKVQLLQLKILKEAHRVCEKHHIKYFLSDGTLIGAVRHRGFIPWDDDIDIGMLRDEYEKFCSICKTELSDEYFLQTMETDPGFVGLYAKLLLGNTVWIEQVDKNCDKQFGVNIDIFPYDVISKNKIKQFFQNKLFVLLKLILRERKKYMVEVPVGIHKQIIYTISRKILNILNDNQLKYLLYKTIVKHCRNNTRKECLVTKFGGNYYRNKNRKSSFEKLISVQFEDAFFPIPAEYDSILINLYGDYMTLPPESKRVNAHDIYSYKF